MNNWPKLISIVLVVLLLDQLSKWWVMEHILYSNETPLSFIEWLGLTIRYPFQSVEVLPFFNFVMVWNKGISFGLFDNLGDTALVLIALSSFISVVILVWMIRTDDIFLQKTLAFILGGAIGNIADRLHFGAVADFLDFHILGYHWPAFNVADCAITVGVVILLIRSIFFEEKQGKS